MTKQEHIKQMESSLDSLVKQLKTTENPVEDIEILDVTVESDLDHDVRGITLTIATGGPHIEIDLYNEVVAGYWSGDKQIRHVRSEEAKASVETLARFYSNHFDRGGK